MLIFQNMKTIFGVGGGGGAAFLELSLEDKKMSTIYFAPTPYITYKYDLGWGGVKLGRKKNGDGVLNQAKSLIRAALIPYIFEV